MNEIDAGPPPPDAVDAVAQVVAVAVPPARVEVARVHVFVIPVAVVPVAVVPVAVVPVPTPAGDVASPHHCKENGIHFNANFTPMMACSPSRPPTHR